MGDMDGVAFAYLRLGMVAMGEEDFRQAASFLDHAGDIYASMGNKKGDFLVVGIKGQVGARSFIAGNLNDLGRTAFDLGEYPRAIQWYNEALETGRDIAESPAILRALRGMAATAQAGGDVTSALKLYKEGLHIAGEVADRKETLFFLESLAGLAADLGRPEQAVRLYSAIQELHDTIRYYTAIEHRSIYAEKVSGLKKQLGEDTFSQAWSQGQAMGLEQAIQLALDL